MTTELGWPASDGGPTLCMNDGVTAAPPASQPLETAMSRETFQHLLTLERHDEDRRLSATSAFFMFLFGAGSGAIWTLLVSWIF